MRGAGTNLNRGSPVAQGMHDRGFAAAQSLLRIALGFSIVYCPNTANTPSSPLKLSATSACARTTGLARNATDKPADAHHLEVVGAVAHHDRAPRVHAEFRAYPLHGAHLFLGIDDPANTRPVSRPSSISSTFACV